MGFVQQPSVDDDGMVVEQQQSLTSKHQVRGEAHEEEWGEEEYLKAAVPGREAFGLSSVSSSTNSTATFSTRSASGSIGSSFVDDRSSVDVNVSSSSNPSIDVDVDVDVNVEVDDSNMGAADDEDTSSLRHELKEQLRSLLLKYHGCTKHDDVRNVINQLVKVNPTSTNCTKSDLFEGEYHTLTAPTFPGRIQPINNNNVDNVVDNVDVGGLDKSTASKVVQYTLGKLSFNLFQPNKLVCTLKSIRNPVRASTKTEPPVPNANSTKTAANMKNKKMFSYHLVSDITIHTPDGQDLPATMMNEAWCYENPNLSNRLMVTFTGGTLMPSMETVEDSSKMQLWKQTFDEAYRRADEERSYAGWMFYYFLKLLFGLSMTLPGSSNTDTGSDDSILSSSNASNTSTTTIMSMKTRREIAKNSFHFDMKRSPTGHFDVLYLDEDIRITKGNRGTVVVVERCRSDNGGDAALTVG
eukprot:CAMPEP_0113482970 /NCGR_PEP_ID=MMETSP0014_2-20120614/23193_1 /TAXON_ID=2857 /ORGANISM="Nitzschia sp." /LENGTH=467 /DNA_ID=CAMNT_0000376503 /DNA_START=143 /DNA_END=1546 /DNA_ORIENTATION=- /assembly_acc=CAM_ASM_000159